MNNRREEADDQQQENQPVRPLGQSKNWYQLAGDLQQDPRGDEVGSRYPEDFTAPEFLEKSAHFLLSLPSQP